jgi:hypothetical protein
MKRISVVSLLAVLIASPPAAPGQVLTRVTPEVGAPGDVLLLTGTNLSGVTGVRFRASVGGFIGFNTIVVTPVQVSATTVTVIVPVVGNFLPPSVLGSSPVGAVSVLAPGPSNLLSFFYFEQTAAQITRSGLGTTWGGMNGLPPVSGFRIAGGAPTAGNSSFVLTLENAMPGSTVTFVVGSPALSPTPYYDGFVPINLAQPYLYAPAPFVVDAFNDVIAPTPLPPSVSGTFTVCWVIATPFGMPLSISNGLTVTF